MQRVPTKSQIRGADRQLEQGWCQQRLELKFIGRTAPVISMYAFPLNKYTSLKKKAFEIRLMLKTSFTNTLASTLFHC